MNMELAMVACMGRPCASPIARQGKCCRGQRRMRVPLAGHRAGTGPAPTLGYRSKKSDKGKTVISRTSFRP